MLCGSVKLCMMKVITLVKAETIAMKKEKRFYVLKSQLGFASLWWCGKLYESMWFVHPFRYVHHYRVAFEKSGKEKQ